MAYKIVLISLIHRNNKKELLLVKRKREPGKDLWSLPGGVGALEEEKDPFKAVHIEVMGDFSTRYECGLFTVRFERQEEILHFYFEGIIDREPEIKENSKTMKETKWFPVEEVLDMKLTFEELDKPVIKEFCDKQSHIG